MLKKSFAFLLSICLILSLSACVFTSKIPDEKIPNKPDNSSSQTPENAEVTIDTLIEAYKKTSLDIDYTATCKSVVKAYNNVEGAQAEYSNILEYVAKCDMDKNITYQEGKIINIEESEFEMLLKAYTVIEGDVETVYTWDELSNEWYTQKYAHTPSADENYEAIKAGATMSEDETHYILTSNCTTKDVAFDLGSYLMGDDSLVINPSATLTAKIDKTTLQCTDTTFTFNADEINSELAKTKYEVRFNEVTLEISNYSFDDVTLELPLLNNTEA